MLSFRHLLVGSACLSLVVSFGLGRSLRADRDAPAPLAAAAPSATWIGANAPVVDAAQLFELSISGSSEHVSVEVVRSLSPQATVGVSEEPPAEPVLLPCGGVTAGSGRFSYPPVCGNTPSEAGANAMLEVIQLIAAGYKCEDCPIPGQCKLQVTTLPDGWTLGDAWYTPSNGSPHQLCPDQWQRSASYEGPFFVSCTPCE